MILDSDAIHLASRNLMIAGFTIAALASACRMNWGYVVGLLLAIYESYNRNRFAFHSWARDQMVGADAPFGAKQVLQSKLIYVGIMALCALALLLIPYLIRANTGRRLMVIGTVMAMTVFALELISPHQIDVILFQTVGFFALSAIVYFASAILIACGAILDRRR